MALSVDPTLPPPSWHNTVVCMNIDRLSITMDSALGYATREAAKRANLSVSAWLAEAAADRLRQEALEDALEQWHSDDGALTPSELATAARSLELAAPRAPRRRSSR